MAETTTAQYWDISWNVTGGCSKGCSWCWAKTQAIRRAKPGQCYDGLVVNDGGVKWTGKARLFADRLDKPLRRGAPTTYHVSLMGDLFDPGITNEEIAAVYGMMEACPLHRFLVLTKNAQRMREWYEWIGEGVGPWLRSHPAEVRDLFAAGSRFTTYRGQRVRSSSDAWASVFNMAAVQSWPPCNVFPGVSVTTQREADRRWGFLREVPAAARWISAEPQIEAIDWRGIIGGQHDSDAAYPHACVRCGTSAEDEGHECPPGFGPRPDWIVRGGMSGHGGAHFDLAWARAARDQCRKADTKYFLKQLGRRPIFRKPEDPDLPCGLFLSDRAGADESEWPSDLQGCRELPAP